MSSIAPSTRVADLPVARPCLAASSSPSVHGAAEPVSGFVHSIETGGTSDGPGIRFVAFLAGCPLRCLYCHNPDALHRRDGARRTAADLLAELGRYAPFLKAAKGGLTLSGGEPLQQPAFTYELLRGAKALGLHTALDTSGYLGRHATDALLDATDLVLLDIKAFSEARYRALTGVPLAPTLRFAERLAAARKPVWLRYVLVPGYTDDLDEIDALARDVASLGNVQRVDVLPFHNMGAFKWQALGMPYRLGHVEPPSDELLIAVRRRFRQCGLETPGTKHFPTMTR